jgi:MFS family permease
VREYPVALHFDAHVLADLAGARVFNRGLTRQIDGLSTGLIGLSVSRRRGAHNPSFFPMPTTARTRTASLPAKVSDWGACGALFAARLPNTEVMGDSGGRPLRAGAARARRATKSVVAASQSAAKAGAKAGNGAARTLNKITHASGAGRTGLAHLIELSAAGSIGDGFVAVALAGTLFFSTSVSQARGRVALALIITMAPFALLAPFIGPMLDRVQNGRRFILIGTVFARGLLCWGMAGAVQHNDSLTLLPAAFGVLLLQKAYGVTRASVTPRLLPTEITLVTANSRCALASLIATTAGVPIAAGIDAIAGGAWVLRVGTIVYLAAMVPGFRIPDGVDEPTGAGTGPAGLTADAPNRQARGKRWRLFAHPVGPLVTEAICANITLRAYSGFMIFFLAFLLRTAHFGSVSDRVALGEMIGAVAVGGFVGTAVGAALRARAPQFVVFTMLGLSAAVTTLCAVFFGLWAAIIVAASAAAGQTLVKLALDSIVQREIPTQVRSSTFAASETLHQLSWVIGGLLGLLLSLTQSGVAGLAVAAAGLTLSLCSLLLARRRRVLRARHQAPAPA